MDATPKQYKKFQISMPEDLLARLDAQAKQAAISRSAFIRLAVLDHLQLMEPRTPRDGAQ